MAADMSAAAAALGRATAKVVAVGRNYAKHAAELNNPVPTSPILFLKPTSSYVRQPGSVVLPRGVAEAHHEVELAVVIGSRLTAGATPAACMDAVAGYALALDMTDRAGQSAAKKAGLPWSQSKGYDTFLPVGDFIARERVPDPHDLELWLAVDGVERQRGRTDQMLFRVPELLAHIAGIFTLDAGDVVLTGTPEGVGPVVAGQTITAGITGLCDVRFGVVAAAASRL